MSVWGRIRKLAAAAAILGCTPLNAYAQAAPVTAPKGFAEIGYEFGSNSLNRTPPFDVPFFLTGDAGERARRVEATFQCWEPKKPTIITTHGPFAWEPRAVSESTANFRILISSPLEAERDCRLTLTLVARPQSDAVAAFRTNALKVLSDELWSRAPLAMTHLSTSDSQKIREALATLLVAASKGYVLRTAGSVFDPATAAPAFDAAAAPVLSEQLNIVAFRRSVFPLQDQLFNRLQAAAQGDVLKKWVASLRELAKTDKNIEAFVTEHETGLSLAGLLDVRDLAFGRTPTAPSIATPDAAVDAAGLQAFESNYAALAGRIRTLLSALESARIARTLTSALSEAEAKALIDLAAGPPPPFGEWRQIFVLARNLNERFTVTREGFTSRAAGIDAMLRMVEIDAIVNVTATITTEAFDFGTVRTNYISMDTGLLYGFALNEVLPYVGANFYLRPVNKDAPLSRAGSFGHRFALTAGVTLKSVAKTNVREDAFFNGALVLGAGFRISPSARASGGVLYFKEFDTNPSKPSARHPAVAFYLGLSLDFDIAKALLGESGLK